jgi:hypothetical protein
VLKPMFSSSHALLELVWVSPMPQAASEVRIVLFHAMSLAIAVVVVVAHRRFIEAIIILRRGCRRKENCQSHTDG